MRADRLLTPCLKIVTPYACFQTCKRSALAGKIRGVCQRSTSEPLSDCKPARASTICNEVQNSPTRPDFTTLRGR